MPLLYTGKNLITQRKKMSVEPVSSLIEFSRQNLADLILTNLLQNFWNQFLPAQLLLLIRSFSRLINGVKKAEKWVFPQSHFTVCVLNKTQRLQFFAPLQLKPMYFLNIFILIWNHLVTPHLSSTKRAMINDF